MLFFALTFHWFYITIKNSEHSDVYIQQMQGGIYYVSGY